MPIKYKPKGYQDVIPYIIVKDIKKLIEFFQKGLNAQITESMTDDSGKINHAEIEIGDSKVMMGRATEVYPPMPVMLYIYVEDCEATYKKCLEAGGESKMEPSMQFWGDMNAGVKEPQGNEVWIATHVEDLTSEEMQKRADEYNKNKK